MGDRGLRRFSSPAGWCRVWENHFLGAGSASSGALTAAVAKNRAENSDQDSKVNTVFSSGRPGGMASIRYQLQISFLVAERELSARQTLAGLNTAWAQPCAADSSPLALIQSGWASRSGCRSGSSRACLRKELSRAMAWMTRVFAASRFPNCEA